MCVASIRGRRPSGTPVFKQDGPAEEAETERPDERGRWERDFKATKGDRCVTKEKVADATQGENEDRKALVRSGNEKAMVTHLREDALVTRVDAWVYTSISAHVIQPSTKIAKNTKITGLEGKRGLGEPTQNGASGNGKCLLTGMGFFWGCWKCSENQSVMTVAHFCEHNKNC